jgi:cell division protein FtsN
MRKNGAASAAAKAVDALSAPAVVIERPDDENALPPVAETPAGECISADEHAYLLSCGETLTEAEAERQRAEVAFATAHASLTSFVGHLIKKYGLDPTGGDAIEPESGAITRAGMR